MQHMSKATLCHVKAMKQVMTYVTAMADCGLTLEPNVKWDGSKDLN